MKRESSSRLIGYFPRNPSEDRSLLVVESLLCNPGKPNDYTVRVRSLEDSVFVEDTLIRSKEDAAVQVRRLKKFLEERGYIIAKI